MSELEDLLRAKAKTGNLHGVTLFNTIGGWQGNVRYNSDGWRVEFHADPIQALIAALKSDVNFDHTAKPVPVETTKEPVLSGGLFD